MSSKGWFNLETAAVTIPETQFLVDDSAFKSLGLTRTQRFCGFAGCYAIGLVLSVLGTVMLFIGGLASFAVLYALGTVISLIGTGFLIGFTKQTKLIFKPIRVVATIVFLAMIVMIFVSAFVLSSGTLCIIFVILEYPAFLWYTLSYIPYARSAVLNVFGMA
ncbi:SFT2-domain-containing protein [Lactarius psammicola]|nr:SFT2-domain-containing protein [Lactarius psammicola]KAI9449518.1 SFT2-domain-containing protein [Lactarius psammicola]